MANKPWELTDEELAKLQDYDEPSNESLGYEKHIAHDARRELIKLLDQPCVEHKAFVDDSPKILNKEQTGWNYQHRKDCPQCWQELRLSL